ncbi:hypothetical protein HELRODRAFT_81951 [Helobdella robusta]|uniref:Terpene cyclase/mutase family member n=1 Tax=Helobdella robusta TaxID=6412 RepID=T1G4K9_HELRO|nr:hypothetical protein HELRODRAFT_81951 [Helobdella robusta]ESO01213.1 hypothetical protein HELRODRAFT_81951 [Helobdella robusta]
MLEKFFWQKSPQYVNPAPRNGGAPRRTDPATDLTRWRLINRKGRQRWAYLGPNNEVTKIDGDDDEYADDLDGMSEEQSFMENANFLRLIQADDGHWPADYGGPLFLMPGLVIACHVTNTTLQREKKLEMVRYLRSVQCREGGWGLHTEAPPTVLGTALNYVTMRLLGVSARDLDLVRALGILRSLGGTLSIPSWGKFWLAVLNVYSWDGLHSLAPELWSLPECLPFHPSKMWCHCRQVYLGMSYCYAVRFKVDDSEIVRQLREELYQDNYDVIVWRHHRSNISLADLHTPHTYLLKSAYYLIDVYEKFHMTYLREKSLNLIYEHVVFDDDVTNFISIGPISKVIQMIVRYHRNDNEALKKHRKRIDDYLWLGTDGLKMNGTNGSQLWDCTFAMQALLEVTLKNGLKFLLATQIDGLNNNNNNNNRTSVYRDFSKYYRHPNKGGFPFSTYECGWIVADCTAEALKTMMMMRRRRKKKKMMMVEKSVNTDNDLDTGDVALLTLQNDDGGFATYERKRGGTFLESLNPSEVFGDVMLDYSYVECTSAAMQAFHFFTEYIDRNYKKEIIKQALEKCLEFIVNSQQVDGSYYGSWAVCYTYGTWFALEGLSCVGYHYVRAPHPSLTKACDWLASKQQPTNGGWGEKFESCELKRYIDSTSSATATTKTTSSSSSSTEEPQVVNTSWALLGLMAAGYPDVNCIERGVRYLLGMQNDDGSYPKQNVSGVFNKTCSIHYDLYRNIFPMWVIARYKSLYGT